MKLNQLIRSANEGGENRDRYKNYLNFERRDDTVILRVKDIGETESYRNIDAYALKFLAKARSNCVNYNEIKCIKIVLNMEYVKKKHLELLRRRLSHYNIHNDENFELVNKNNNLPLYSEEELYNPPSKEIGKTDFTPTTKKFTGEKKEKLFQDFLLFGAGEIKKEDKEKVIHNLNERFVILGDDFYSLDKEYYINHKLIKEFNVTDTNSILPNNRIDYITVNKYGKLALIELKFGTDLAILSQILDYAIHFKRYNKDYNNIYRLLNVTNTKEIDCYIAANTFHPNLKDIKSFYLSDKEDYFTIKKVTYLSYKRL